MDSWSLVKVGTTQSQRKLFYRLNKEKQKLEALGMIPAPALLASNLDVKEEEIEEMEKRLAFTDLSLDSPIHNEGDDTIMDMIRGGEDVEEVVSEKEKREIIAQSVKEFKKTLNGKEVFIFERRIIAEEPLTLQEIGEEFKISRERARQIENRVIKKFKERFETEFQELDF